MSVWVGEVLGVHSEAYIGSHVDAAVSDLVWTWAMLIFLMVF